MTMINNEGDIAYNSKINNDNDYINFHENKNNNENKKKNK